MKGEGSILIIERDAFMRQLLQETLADFRLYFAEDGYSGLEMARRMRPDLIILEPLIPKVDGFQLCLLLKRDPETRDIPVLMFTILSAKERAEQVGADGFLMKPLNKRELLAKVEELIRR